MERDWFKDRFYAGKVRRLLDENEGDYHEVRQAQYDIYTLQWFCNFIFRVGVGFHLMAIEVLAILLLTAFIISRG